MFTLTEIYFCVQLFLILVYILLLQFPALHTAILEEWIDRIDSTLPPIVNFVIPVSFWHFIGL